MGTIVFHPLQIICSQGDDCVGVYLVAKGSILLFVRSKPTPRPLRLLGRHETFGEDVLINRYTCTTGVTTTEDEKASVVIKEEETTTTPLVHVQPEEQQRRKEDATTPFDQRRRCLFYSAVARDFSEVLILRLADLAELRFVSDEFRKVYDACASQARETLKYAVAEKLLRPWVQRRLKIRRHFHQKMQRQKIKQKNAKIKKSNSNLGEEADPKPPKNLRQKLLDLRNRSLRGASYSSRASRTSRELDFDDAQSLATATFVDSATSQRVKKLEKNTRNLSKQRNLNSRQVIFGKLVTPQGRPDRDPDYE